VIRLLGHVRSGSSTLSTSWYGLYLWIGIAEADCVFFIVSIFPLEEVGDQTNGAFVDTSCRDE
jgi:hypothetical protein